MSRERAETMPAVTVPPCPNGFPTAITHSPMRGAWSAISTNLNPGAAVHLEQRDIGLRIACHDPRRIGVAVVGFDRDRRAMLDHIIGGHRVAIGGDKKAGPLARRRASVPRGAALIGCLAKSRQKSLVLIVCGSLFIHHPRAYAEHRGLHARHNVLEAARRRLIERVDCRLEPLLQVSPRG